MHCRRSTVNSAGLQIRVGRSDCQSGWDPRRQGCGRGRAGRTAAGAVNRRVRGAIAGVSVTAVAVVIIVTCAI